MILKPMVSEGAFGSWPRRATGTAANRVGYIFQGAVGSGNVTSVPWPIQSTLNGHDLDGTNYKVKWVVFDGSPNHNAAASFPSSQPPRVTWATSRPR